MKYLPFLFLFVFSMSASAQSEAYVEKLNLFKTHYNEENAQAVYDMMSPSMQDQLSFDLVEQIVTSFQKRYGALKAVEYKETNGNVEIYLGIFENGNQNISLSVNKDGFLDSLLFRPAEVPDATPKFERNTTVFGLPFKGEWFTVWGGDTKAQNYHVIDRGQRRAFDFLVLGKNNKTYERSGTRNEDYFAFGKPLYAICDAEVIQVIDGVEDNKPGDMNPKDLTGNSVVLKTANNEYIFYAHFENSTIKVKEGQMVKRGQNLGNCGNSGNSTEPHLHLHVQDGPDLFADVGVKCFFEKMMVNGELKKDYSPVRLDRISPAEN